MSLHVAVPTRTMTHFLQRLSVATVVATSAWLAAAPIQIGSPDQISLEFAADARPKSLQVAGREVMDVANPGAGFTLMGYEPARPGEVGFPFRSMALQGNQLVVSLNQTSRVTFEVKAAPRYLAFRLVRVEGIPKENLLWLKFHLRGGPTMKFLPLDFMTKPHSQEEVHFPWLWKRNPSLPLGGFAIYVPSSPGDEDETLLHIWANEGLPHPKVAGEWNVETARKWLADWQRMFSDQSQMLISAANNQELYQLADYAATLDIKRIYMHTDTWRGEYWPSQFSFLHLNPQVFPNGEADFKAFADYTRRKGMGITIHTVSASIAPNDPDYLTGKVDDRLARWIDGTLAEAVSESATELKFRPNPGQVWPLVLDRPITGPAHVDYWNDLRVVRIGNELIDVAQFADTDQEVWTLRGCTRGLYRNGASAHAQGAGVIGLIRPYGQVFTADSDSTLVDEIGARFAGFYNRNNIIHCEQDAGEIHTVNHPWGYAKFAEAIYRNLEHPVTSNNSGGHPMPCQFEYRFNSSREVLAARKQTLVPILLARSGRPATGPYELGAFVGREVAAGGRSVGLQKPEPMFGIGTEILNQHGLMQHAAYTVKTWKQLGPLLNPEQRQRILGSSDQEIFRAASVEGGFEITPLRMLMRPGVDIGWQPGSEFGPIVPRQYFRTGETIRVENPWAAQCPEFVIRVLPALEAGSPAGTDGANPGQSTPSAAEQAALDAYNTGTGRKIPASSGVAPATPSASLQPTSAQIQRAGDHVFSDNENGLRVRFDNLRAEPVSNQEALPFWAAAGSMQNARGIGLTVHGDGSNALLVIQTNTRGPRDYIVPLDFTGPRDIVIPCGEAAWADQRWGWRMATKDTHYSELDQVSMGFGKIPPQTKVDVTISKLRLLPESPQTLKNPVISIQGGSLAIDGDVPSESYLWFRGGNVVTLHDLNWKQIGSLRATNRNFSAPQGPLEVRIDAGGVEKAAWLECQFFVKDTPLVVSRPKR